MVERREAIEPFFCILIYFDVLIIDQNSSYWIGYLLRKDITMNTHVKVVRVSRLSRSSLLVSSLSSIKT